MSRLSRKDIEDLCNPKSFKPKKPKKAKSIIESSLPIIRFTDEGKPVHVFASQIDSNAWTQAEGFANLPFIHPKGLALMPDVHFGKDVPIGSVLPTLGALVPAATGVDIGCGINAVKLNIKANQLPDNLRKIRLEIEKSVPLSSGGRHKSIPQHVLNAWKELDSDNKYMQENHVKAYRANSIEQLGTLGSGNHFIEICIDESQNVWAMLHSGSRGVGSNIGRYFIEQARQRTLANGKLLNGIGWLNETDPVFNDYVFATLYAQKYAMLNRKVMMQSVINALIKSTNLDIQATDEAVNCHHNYIAKENHFGEDIWITRKGAIKASLNDLGVIPSSMGNESFIVRGLGNAESFHSCAHGAGRVMSRIAAKQRFTRKDLQEATKGVECRKDRAIIDEIPYAYKPINQVMKDQKSLVEKVHTLKAIICVKGV